MACSAAVTSWKMGDTKTNGYSTTAHDAMVSGVATGGKVILHGYSIPLNIPYVILHTKHTGGVEVTPSPVAAQVSAAPRRP